MDVIINPEIKGEKGLRNPTPNYFYFGFHLQSFYTFPESHDRTLPPRVLSLTKGTSLFGNRELVK